MSGKPSPCWFCANHCKNLKTVNWQIVYIFYTVTYPYFIKFWENFFCRPERVKRGGGGIKLLLAVISSHLGLLKGTDFWVWIGLWEMRTVLVFILFYSNGFEHDWSAKCYGEGGFIAFLLSWIIYKPRTGGSYKVIDSGYYFDLYMARSQTHCSNTSWEI